MFSVVSAMICTLEAFEIIGFLLPQQINARASDFLLLALTTACLLTLLILYPATAFKLYRQSRNVKPLPTRLSRLRSQATGGQVDAKPTSTEVKTNSMHVQALKIYTAISLQFLLLNLLVLGAVLIWRQLWMPYFFFINHIGNPVIYYCFVRKFREGLHQALRSCAGNRHCWNILVFGYESRSA